MNEELIKYMELIQTFDKDASQDGTALNSYLIELTNFMARANFIMAEKKREIRQSKIKAYQHIVKWHGEGKYFAPSLAKDYVDSLSYEASYTYDLAERCSRLCTHAIEAVRSILMSLMNERKFANYAA